MATTTTLPPSIPATHLAIALPAPGAPLQLLTVPTHPPSPSEALIHVTHTSSTPLDMHRAAGGLLIEPNDLPFIMGTTFGGTVVALGGAGSNNNNNNNKESHGHGLSVGDKVFGFVQDGVQREAGFQEYVTVPVWKVSKLPAATSMEQAVTVPTNLVTAVHTAVEDLGLELPWPVPTTTSSSTSEEGKGGGGGKGEVVLVWGAASSVGMYTVQVLRHWGYGNVWAVAAGKHHETLRGLGARECFDYRKGDVVEEILARARQVGDNGSGRPRVPFIVDCIGSLEGTLRPLSRIAESGSKVAVMLPVINVHAGEDQAPDLEMDVNKVLPGEWADGVELRGVRTFFYAKNEFLKHRLQSEIVPTLLAQGVIQPNKPRIVEGSTMLERAENALDLLRKQAVSGEKLVWRIADEEN